MKKIIIILVFLVCGISSAQQYFFNGTVYVPKTTVQINAITAPVNGRVEANSDTGSLWYFDGAIWKDTFVGVSSFADLTGDPYDNTMLSDALNSKAADSVVVKTSLDSQIQNLKLAVGDSAWIASKTFGANDIVINTDENPPGGDNYVTGGTLSGAGVLSLEMNYGPDITVPGFNSGGGGGSVSWGGIGGTIGDQTDMMALFGGKENSFAKNTAFNKNYGTTAGTVLQGNWRPTWSEVTGKPSIFATNWTNVADKPSTFPPSSHTHNASDINTGTLNIARIPTGTTSATVKIGNWVPSWDEITNKSSVMLKSENLSGLSNYATARANLSLGSLALLNVVSGSQIMDGSITTAKIVDNQITNAKAADMAANTLKGRLTSSGDPQDLTVSQARDLLGIPITSGTFSPTLDDGNENGSFTYTVEFAKYFRIGGNVVLNIHISGINGTGSGGGLEIYGIPTTIGQANPGYYYNPINSIVYGSTNYNNGDIGFFINGDIIQSYETDDLGVPINVSFTDGEIFINATYLANY